MNAAAQMRRRAAKDGVEDSAWPAPVTETPSRLLPTILFEEYRSLNEPIHLQTGFQLPGATFSRSPCIPATASVSNSRPPHKLARISHHGNRKRLPFVR